MGHIPVARAHALPGHADTTAHASPWSAITHHARHRGDEQAYVLLDGDRLVTRTWSEVAAGVETAAAGLVRSGLRVDQVVVSLLPSDHAFPELDLALRTVGAVVVHVGPRATAEDLARDLGDVHVRLVVAESLDDVTRLQGLPLAHAELFTLDGGRGWDRLLELGRERLLMDPTAVERADRIVDPDGAVPRLLDGGVPLGRVSGDALRDGVLGPGHVVLAVGDAADPLVHLVRAAHPATGFALCVVQDPARAAGAAAAVRPSVLVVPSADAIAATLAVLEPGPAARGRRARGWRSAAAGRGARGAAPRGLLVVTTAVPEAVRTLVADHGSVLEVVEDLDLLPPDLPQPPPVVIGDVTQLPRRSRRAPVDDFELRLDAPEPDASAFSLPSLPLMSGESFLDQLLLSRAREARE